VDQTKIYQDKTSWNNYESYDRNEKNKCSTQSHDSPFFGNICFYTKKICKYIFHAFITKLVFDRKKYFWL